MNELLREIEEDIRRERFTRLWHSFGKIMIGASVAVILATVGIVLWQNYRQGRAFEQTAQLLKGADRLNIEDYKGAIAVFGELATDDNSPYYGIAMLRKAAAERAGGDREAAVKTYAGLAKQNTVFGQLAAMQAPPVGTKAPPDKNSLLYYTQSEWNGWQQLEHGRKDEAVAQFLALRDDAKTPYSMRRRLQEALQHIAPGNDGVPAHE